MKKIYHYFVYTDPKCTEFGTVCMCVASRTCYISAFFKFILRWAHFRTIQANLKNCKDVSVSLLRPNGYFSCPPPLFLVSLSL
jgi:hypothetical protein